MAALNELAEASKVGFRVNWEKIPISEEALALQSYFKLTDEQLLAMSSTGTILAAIDPQAQEKIEDTLSRNGLPFCFIGEFRENKDLVLIKNGKETAFPQAAIDPYAMILSGK
jgi:hydrogenase maturation factor